MVEREEQSLLTLDAVAVKHPVTVLPVAAAVRVAGVAREVADAEVEPRPEERTVAVGVELEEEFSAGADDGGGKVADSTKGPGRTVTGRTRASLPNSSWEGLFLVKTVTSKDP